MSYQVLARKWRPKSFETLIGQEQTAQALINALESQRLHHAYLFTGTRGVGKTTIARILSKSLNCETGITSKPCGECSSCLEIDAGNFVDLMEIDAASKTKVEDTRELLDNVQYRPSRGRYKVYLIDEVHMLSGHSFNALLKTLEEPPPHVVFLLATTDPQKLPVTVLSRCLQFHLKQMEEESIVNYLTEILTSESIAYEVEALPLVAKGADGSMRDALSLLDQAIAFSGEKITKRLTEDMLGTIDQNICINLLRHLHNSDVNGLMDEIKTIAQYSPDYFEVFQSWLSMLHNIAVSQATSSITDDALEPFVKTISASDLQYYYQISLQAKKDLPYAPNPRQGFEMAMLRIIAFRPSKNQSANTGNRATSSQADTTPVTESAKKKHLNLRNQKKTGAPEDPILSRAQAKVVDCENHVKTETTKEEKKSDRKKSFNNSDKSNETQVNRVEHQKTDTVAEPSLNDTTAVAADSNVGILDKNVRTQRSLKETEYLEKSNSTKKYITSLEAVDPIALDQITDDNWQYVVDQMGIEGNGFQVLSNSNAKYENNCLEIFHHSKVSHFLTDNLISSLKKKISNHFEKSVSEKFDVVLSPRDDLVETPKEKQQKKFKSLIDRVFEDIKSDACVKKFTNEIDAIIDRSSIKVIE